MAKTLYFNLEDDIKSIIARLRQEHGDFFVLVFPRRSYIFADSVNLKLLKKHLDALGKEAAILTMDERGQAYATEAGFALKSIPVRQSRRGMGDIATSATPAARQSEPVRPEAAALPVRERPSVPVPAAPRRRPVPQADIPRVAVRDTVFSDVPKRSSFTAPRHESGPGRVRSRRLVWLGAVALVVLMAIVLGTVVLPTATVVVYAKPDQVVRDLEINMSTAFADSDVARLQIPAATFERVLEASGKFQAAGKKEMGSVAEGKVRIFNLSGAPLNLRAATTTFAVNGKTYSLAADQNGIKALSEKNATSPDAGHLAAVKAGEPGEGFNLKDGTRLEVTNQVFGSKPQLLYARAEGDITGGNSRFVSVVSEADIAGAKEVLTKQALDQLTAAFKSEGKYLAEKAYAAEPVEFAADKPAGTEAPVFNGELKLKVSGIVFDPVALSALVRKRVEQVLPKMSALQPVEKDALSFRVRQLDVAGGNMRTVVHLESRSFRNIDEAVLRKDLPGKYKDVVKNDLSKRAEVEKVEITASPGWFKTLPRMSSRIQLEIRRD